MNYLVDSFKKLLKNGENHKSQHSNGMINKKHSKSTGKINSNGTINNSLSSSSNTNTTIEHHQIMNNNHYENGFNLSSNRSGLANGGGGHYGANNTLTLNRQSLIYRRSPITPGPPLPPLNANMNGNNGADCLDDISNSSDNFKRSTKARMSLPILHHHNMMMMRRQATYGVARNGRNELQFQQSLGRIYLQYRGETKQANLPNELTTLDTIKALFVCAFPNLLSMEYMSQPHVKIYIYNPSCNIFYELNDINDVKHESVLRIHQTSPVTFAVQPPQAIQQLHQSPSNMQYQSNVNPNSMRLTPIHHYSSHQLAAPVPPVVAPPPPPQPQPKPQLQINRNTPPNQQQQQQQQQQQVVPPPKPRRMIPVVNGLNQYNAQPNVIYRMSTSTPLNGLH